MQQTVVLRHAPAVEAALHAGVAARCKAPAQPESPAHDAGPRANAVVGERAREAVARRVDAAFDEAGGAVGGPVLLEHAVKAGHLAGHQDGAVVLQPICIAACACACTCTCTCGIGAGQFTDDGGGGVCLHELGLHAVAPLTPRYDVHHPRAAHAREHAGVRLLDEAGVVRLRSDARRRGALQHPHAGKVHGRHGSGDVVALELRHGSATCGHHQRRQRRRQLQRHSHGVVACIPLGQQPQQGWQCVTHQRVACRARRCQQRRHLPQQQHGVVHRQRRERRGEAVPRACRGDVLCTLRRRAAALSRGVVDDRQLHRVTPLVHAHRRVQRHAAGKVPERDAPRDAGLAVAVRQRAEVGVQGDTHHAAGAHGFSVGGLHLAVAVPQRACADEAPPVVVVAEVGGGAALPRGDADEHVALGAVRQPHVPLMHA